MGKIVIPKNSASLEEVMGAMQIYYDTNDWLQNSDFIQTYKDRIGIIGDDNDSSAYTKKTEIGAYYGFLEWEDINKTQSPRRITPRGKVFLEHYNSNNTEAVHEDIMKSLEDVTFGRNNFACRSCDSDVEPPALFLRAILELGYLTNTEFAYLVYRMEYEGKHYTEILQEIRQIRDNGNKIELPDDARKFSDPKPILMLERWGVLTSQQAGEKRTMIDSSFLEKYRNRIRNLKIYNIDKNVGDENDNLDKQSESADNIFEGFTPWLTSFDNPDYTGKEKYDGYPRALERLVEFMLGKGLITDANLNDKDLAKYLNYKTVYEASEEVREYDKTKLASSAGIAALKKYIKYVEFLNESRPQVSSTFFDYSSTKGKGINKIFYGTPGCGKSYYIEHEILEKENYAKENIIRTTFYQDYSNTDFVGQILPKIVRGKSGEKDTVEYIFNPGPFTLALIQAISNPSQKVALVVEEINRGNAPAIFGDIFQLLDRDDDCISEYGIVNVGVMDYLNNYTFMVDGKEKKYIFSDIKIPGNMYIYATMNTSDQNVYTLDTAFVRRWGKEKIQNSFTKCTFRSASIPGMPNYTWEEFVVGINNCIASHLEDLQVNEDKQIGAYVVKEKFLNESTPEEFAYKVFDYLWSDVAKLDHAILFKPFDTLDKLIAAYKNEGVRVFQSGIFAEKLNVQQPINEPKQEDDSDE